METNHTAGKVLTWGALGVGLGLVLSDNRRLGAAVMLISPAIVALEHPREMRKALRTLPRNIERCGRTAGRAMRAAGEQLECGAREAGKGLRWLAS